MEAFLKQLRRRGRRVSLPWPLSVLPEEKERERERGGASMMTDGGGR